MASNFGNHPSLEYNSIIHPRTIIDTTDRPTQHNYLPLRYRQQQQQQQLMSMPIRRNLRITMKKFYLVTTLTVSNQNCDRPIIVRKICLGIFSPKSVARSQTLSIIQRQIHSSTSYIPFVKPYNHVPNYGTNCRKRVPHYVRSMTNTCPIGSLTKHSRNSINPYIARRQSFRRSWVLKRDSTLVCLLRIPPRG